MDPQLEIVKRGLEMAINLSWEAIGVISAVGTGVLGWLFKLQADIVSLKSEILHLKGENKDFKTFMEEFKEFKERFIRLEEKISLLIAHLGGEEK